jgi:hypothetical protein
MCCACLLTPSHPPQPSFDMFLSRLRHFEFRAKIRIKNLPEFREKSKTSKRKKKSPFLPAELFPSPPAISSLKDVLHNPRVDLFLPEAIFPAPPAASSLKDMLLDPQVIYLETGFCAFREFSETGSNVLRVVSDRRRKCVARYECFPKFKS